MALPVENKAGDYQTDISSGVNTVKDPENLTDLEKRHLPVIEAPKKVRKNQPFEVTIHVGKLLEHPNEPRHFIEFIELYAGKTYMARLDCIPERTLPIMKVSLSLDHPYGKLRAFHRCNLHGTWENNCEIELGL